MSVESIIIGFLVCVVAVSIALFAYTNEMEGAGKSKDIKRFFILFLVLTIFFGIMSYKP